MSEARERPPHAERPGGLLSRIGGHLVMYHAPRSPHAEQYRACRTNLAALNRNGAPWVIVVTSSRKGEGKSVTAANLAACFAELPGARVALVDADFRAPSQAGLFSLPNEPGLTDVIEERAQLKDVALRSVLENLEIYPAGKAPRRPAELLGGERFAAVLAELRRRHTWVLIDTPPVNPYTDGCVLAARCQGALLVVRMEETQKGLVQRSVQSLTRAGAKVLGTFLTGLSPDGAEADRYGYGHVDEDDNLLRSEYRKEKARLEAEKALRKQEQAWLEEQKDKS